MKYLLTRKVKTLQKALQYKGATSMVIEAGCNGRIKKDIMTGQKKIFSRTSVCNG